MCKVAVRQNDLCHGAAFKRAYFKWALKWPAAVIWHYAWKGVILRVGVLNQITTIPLQLP